MAVFGQESMILSPHDVLFSVALYGIASRCGMGTLPTSSKAAR
jgi:hypothetical protein